MLTAAGGIILAVLCFVFHPQSLVVASALFALVLIVGGAALAVVLVGPWETVGIIASLAGFALIVWYRIMAASNHQIDDDFRRRYPYQHPFTNLRARSRAKRGCEGDSKIHKKFARGDWAARARRLWTPAPFDYPAR
jgi:hypothetical protein